MSLTVRSESVSGVIPKFAKVFELFTGGFGFTAAALARHTSGVTLPAGALLQVNEATRECSPVKRARLAAYVATAATSVKFEPGHLFRVGDYVFIEGTATGGTIATITEGATYDTIAFAAGVNINKGVAAGAWAQHVSTANATAGTAVVINANAIAAFPTTIEAGASVAALRRGTVYKNRIQPIVTADSLPVTILLSDSN